MVNIDKDIIIPVIEGEVLGVKVIRGFENLSLLSAISRADIFDVDTNPTGTQRDLSPKHAREAYDYVLEEKLIFWPELFLCLRDKSILKIETNSKGQKVAIINGKKISKAKSIKISRVDGNHRLHFADGHDPKYPPLDKNVSFCIALDLTLDEEIKLFRDINDNQKRMNTSHLDNIFLKLSDEEKLKQEKPNLFIAQRLSDDADSPFYGKVHKGGKADKVRFMPLRNLSTGISYMFSGGGKLTAITDIDVRLKLIKNYFVALQSWQPEAWEKPKDYILLRGAGFWAACVLGTEIIDRCLAEGKFNSSDMLQILKSGPQWNWRKGGDFSGYGGRSGAQRIRDMIVSELADESGTSLKSLVDQISKDI